ncbi:MAG: hypothetical protein ABIR37_03850 [Candidatus Saccharimonadales bacterium]
MTATNHALTGAIIGLSVGNPFLAIVLAFASHFALDALPHYGPSKPDIGGKGFRNYLILDVGLCVLLVLVLALSGADHWILASICAFAATSPDAMWVPDFLRARRGQKERNFAGRSVLVRIHAFVQWYQKPLGAITEVAWFSGAVAVLQSLAR